jgi:hypothetical protein
MLNRLGVAVALAFWCAAGLGCRSMMQCGDGCAEGCGRGSSLAFSKYDCSCDGVCGECCGGEKCDCCEPCDGGVDGRDGCCGAGCGGDKSRWRLLDRICGCHGCGELYWSEWHNDPPALCEPCDCLGNYTGCGAAGCYRAPYRRPDELVSAGRQSAPPALEVADGDIVR